MKTKIEEMAKKYAYDQSIETEYNSRTDDLEYAFTDGYQFAIQEASEGDWEIINEVCKTDFTSKDDFEKHRTSYAWLREVKLIKAARLSAAKELAEMREEIKKLKWRLEGLEK